MNKIIFTLLILFFSSFVFAQELEYNYIDTKAIPVKLKITKEISTKDNLLEGSEVSFKVVNNVFYKGKYYAKKGDTVTARIETIITKGFNGFPAEIIIENFNFDNISDSQIIGTYTKVGANRCYWVYPIKWALTPIPLVGSFTILILGGEATIKTTDIITIHFYPNWK